MAAAISVGIQTSCEAVIQNNESLKKEACTAFNSYVRAYATHSKESRGVFNLRTLHLGHVAKVNIDEGPPPPTPPQGPGPSKEPSRGCIQIEFAPGLKTI